MATKNLARTLIEGGQSRSAKSDRRRFNRRERHRARLWCRDVDRFEAEAAPWREPAPFEPNDRGAPLYRWLLARVGQPWSAVYSALHALTDSRTLEGWHLIYAHAKQSVNFVERVSSSGFYVMDGLLCYRRYQRRSYRRPPTVGDAALRAFCASRWVIDYGAVQFWTAPGAGPYDVAPQEARWVPSPGGQLWLPLVGYGRAQGARFTPAEKAFWARLSAGDRDKLRWKLRS